MEQVEHKIIPINGLNMHVASLGQGPTILFVHGFPELWYMWRHQMVSAASHGFRAVAPDMRGYGETTGAPLDDPSKFTIHHLVGDLVMLIDAITDDQEEKVFVVGHDWGAYVAWNLCLFRPDKVRALVALSVAFLPRDPFTNFVEIFRGFYGDDHYICRFQEPGDVEDEFAKIGVKQVMKNILGFRTPGPFYFPKGKGFGYSTDRPSWLTEEDLDFYVSRFEQTGFTGGVNYYRALPLNWEMTASWTVAQVQVPAKFIVGELDLTYHVPGTKEFIHKGGFEKFVPSLEEVVVLEGAAHFVNQERPDEVNDHIISFLKRF